MACGHPKSSFTLHPRVVLGGEGEEPLGNDVIQACEMAIVHETGYRLKLWEKCLMCGEKLACCACA